MKSDDYEQVYFVAAKIYGPGIDENKGAGPGIWAISGTLENPGITLAVDGFAQQFSDWTDGSKTDAKTSPADRGAQEAKYCAQVNK